MYLRGQAVPRDSDRVLCTHRWSGEDGSRAVEEGGVGSSRQGVSSLLEAGAET